MLKRLVNQMLFTVAIDPVDPLSILAGKPGEGDAEEETGNELKIIRAHRPEDGREVPVIPGSSLKGVLRSHCERITRTLGGWACNPFHAEPAPEDETAFLRDPTAFCGKKVELMEEGQDAPDIPRRYRECSCRICKTFGSTGFGSHLLVADARPTGPVTEVGGSGRPGVAIDRVLGSVAVGPWFIEAVERGTFLASLELRNYELWQVGLLGLALRDMVEQRVRIGHGKSRGFGKVKATVRRVEIRYHGFRTNGPRLERLVGAATDSLPVRDGDTFWAYGIGKLVDEDTRADYGYQESDAVSVTVQGATNLTPDWVSAAVTLTDYEEQIKPLLKACVEERWIPEVEADASNPNTGQIQG